MKKLFVLCTFLTIGCSANVNSRVFKNNLGEPLRYSSLPITWGIAKNVPEEFHDGIREAFAFWEKQVGIPLFFEFDTSTRDPLDPESGALVMVGYFVGEYKTIDFANFVYSWQKDQNTFRTHTILLFDELGNMSAETRTNRLRHMVGHVLGLTDTGNESSVMFRGLHLYEQEGFLRATNEDTDAVKYLYNNSR